MTSWSVVYDCGESTVGYVEVNSGVSTNLLGMSQACIFGSIGR